MRHFFPFVRHAMTWGKNQCGKISHKTNAPGVDSAAAAAAVAASAAAGTSGAAGGAGC